VIFDLDGTLIDSLPGIEFSVKSAFAACGIPYPAVDLRSMIGPPIRTILEQVARTSEPAILACLESAFRTSYDSEGWRKSYCYSGTKAALASLYEAGLRLFVVTNKPRHITLRILEVTGILHFFQGIVTRGSRIPEYADKKEMVASLIDSCGVEPEGCVLVGDTVEDANAACACGIRFAHASHGYGTFGDDHSTPVHLRLNDFSQLLQWIGLEFAHD
jgi:phosphoglycolate phosphatase